MKVAGGLALAMAFVFGTWSIDVDAQSPVEIGDAQTMVHKKLGRNPVAHRRLSEDYSRISFAEEFRLNIQYVLDDVKSRLNPVPRVWEVNFFPDKREPWNITAMRIPELRQLCASGCMTVAAISKLDGYLSPDAYLMGCASHPADSGNWWEKRKEAEQCFEVNFANLPEKLFDDADLDWSALEVDSITLCIKVPSDPQFTPAPYSTIKNLDVVRP